jgi:hypothetical protein
MPPSLTAWTRLEPRPRAPSIAPALAARIRDPLWLLTRQWQVGEFQGEDAGAPAWAQVAATTAAFTGWLAEGERSPRPLDGNPLEEVVEREPLGPDLMLRVELGQRFEELLDRAGASASDRAAIRAAYPLPPLPGDPPDAILLTLPFDASVDLAAGTLTSSLLATFAEAHVALSRNAGVSALEQDALWTIADLDYDRRYVITAGATGEPLAVRLGALDELAGDREAGRFRQVCARRSIDGYQIWRAAMAGLPVLPPPAVQAVEAAAAALAGWVAVVYGELGVADAPAWQPERLEYRLAAVTGAPDATTATLAAHGGRTGDFEWYAFDLAETSSDQSATDTIRFSILPGHVSFRGSPNRRWWNFEAGTTPWGEIEPDRRDVAKLVLIDFMLVHGNDWFAIPLEQPVGTLCRIDTLVVTDVFGVSTLIERADTAAAGGELPWTLFSTALESAPGQVADFFVLPPTTAAAAQPGPVIEEVRFLRDEMANLVWGVEASAENGIGEAWPGHERDRSRQTATDARPPGTSAASPSPPLRYLIQTLVPESWIPFLPVAIDPANGVVRLERSYVRHGEAETAPIGRILRPSSLQPDEPYRIFEEEVPREGTRVCRRPIRARWTDGSTRVWLARERSIGTGEGASGLRFDLAVPVGVSPDDV